MASITSLVAAEVLVMRDGNTIKIDATELVPGDIVKLTLGAKVRRRRARTVPHCPRCRPTCD